MDEHRKVVVDVEKKIKTKIESGITQVLKEAENSKAAFQRAAENVGELTGKINDFMQKFDQVKEEMNENGKRFENYQASVETKRLEMQVLETEIQNIQMFELRQKKLVQEVEEERKKITTQIEALKKLKNALSDQHRTLSVSLNV